jgi:ankyrin repeat protein
VDQALAAGAQVDALVPLRYAPKRRATPPARAAANGDLEAVRLLLRRAPSNQLNQTAVGSLPAAGKAATRYTPLMVAACPNVLISDDLAPTLYRNWPLVTLYKGSLAVVRELLAAGADPTVRDSRGRTALALAAESGQPRMLRYLLDQGLRDLGAAGQVEPVVYRQKL